MTESNLLTEEIESLIEKCFQAMASASLERMDGEKADRNAALFLVAQMRLSSVIEEVEMKAKGAKNEIARVEGEKYFEYKVAGGSGGKVTEAMLVNSVAKDIEIVKVKEECARQEATLKKWGYVMNTLKDGHVYFRNVGKNKGWGE